MGRNNTKAVKNIAKMYEQLGLAQDDIFHKTKLLLSICRDVVWARFQTVTAQMRKSITTATI